MKEKNKIKRKKPILLIIFCIITLLFLLLIFTDKSPIKKIEEKYRPSSFLPTNISGPENLISNYGVTMTPTPTKVPQINPSERSLKAVNYAFYIQNTIDQDRLLKELQRKYSVEGEYLALRTWAKYLDTDLQELIRVETINESIAIEKSRPIYNTTNTTNNTNTTTKDIDNNVNCTTSYIGNYAYTNCY